MSKYSLYFIMKARALLGVPTKGRKNNLCLPFTGAEPKRERAVVSDASELARREKSVTQVLAPIEMNKYVFLCHATYCTYVHACQVSVTSNAAGCKEGNKHHTEQGQ